MPKRFRHVHGLLEHNHAERNSGYPAHETDDGEDTEYGENHSSRIIVLHKVVYCRSDAEDDMQDARYPDELLCKSSSYCEVGPRQDQSNDEDEDKEDNGVSVEGKVVACVVNSSSAKRFVGGVPLQGNAGDCSKAKEG